MDWVGVISALILIVFWVGYFLVTKYRKLSWKNELSERVSWIVSDKKRDMSLWKYVWNAQNHCKIAEQYRIATDEEWQLVREILEEFKKDLSRNYFDGVLKAPIKSKYVINEEQYLMLYLCSFLKERQCNGEFLGYEMHDEIIEHNYYGYSNFSATYRISDFAVVYHKLLYIAYVVCKTSNGINIDGQFYYNESSIEEVITKKILKVSRF